MSKKHFLYHLIEQLEDEKVDSLIDVVEGMVHSTNRKTLKHDPTMHVTNTVTEHKNGDAITIQQMNELFI